MRLKLHIEEVFKDQTFETGEDALTVTPQILGLCNMDPVNNQPASAYVGWLEVIND